jgi:RNA polymerase sigma-70 factor (ECF subfamily)
LQLVNKLLQIEYSPIAALDRTYALSKANGKAEAILDAEKLNLTDNHFYYTLLGELCKGIDNSRANMNLKKRFLWPEHRQTNRQFKRKLRTCKS